uniref:Uncharacterized protein n=1 Tax=Lepeophtheirus salmonis TaxID=72036 RepID=A0A0K2UZG0_LEPSM
MYTLLVIILKCYMSWTFASCEHHLTHNIRISTSDVCNLNIFRSTAKQSTDLIENE